VDAEQYFQSATFAWRQGFFSYALHISKRNSIQIIETDKTATIPGKIQLASVNYWCGPGTAADERGDMQLLEFIG
jgi:hypothetical protein